MYIIPYPWTKEELNKMAYEKEDRFGGILIPFLGGALIGSYFFPRPNYQYPWGQFLKELQFIHIIPLILLYFLNKNNLAI